MDNIWTRKVNIKRPKGMSKWKWHEQLKKEEILKKELARKEEKEFVELNKFLKDKEKKKIKLPTWLDNVFTRLIFGNLILGLIFVPILILILILFLSVIGFFEWLF